MLPRRKKISAPSIIAALILILASWFFATNQDAPIWDGGIPSADFVDDTRLVSIYYLDVGQGDSTLIRLPSGETILIDAGLSETDDALINRLRQLGVKKVDHLIATHPHADHIGGMAKVIEDMEIGKFYLPRVADKQVPTTRTYENMLDAAAAKGLKLTQGKAGMTILQSDDTKLEFLGPVSEKYDDLNDYSIVVKLTFGKRRFLFMGDAEKTSENELLDRTKTLGSDVLKVGHHGSNSSSTAAFLKVVEPKYAIISCGLDNSYGHPHKEVLSRLERIGATVYRTDLNGTILLRCDGNALSFRTGLSSVTNEK